MAVLAAVLLAGTFAVGTAFAGVITSPVSGVIDFSGPGFFGTLNDTINQNGLSSGFTSGVTDFNTYIATNPTHTLVFAGNEWFGASGPGNSQVTYDMGSIVAINRLALWNEESTGIGNLNLLSSTDGVTFSPLASDLSPTDNPLGSYPADIFSFATTNARFIRFEMSECPQPNPGSSFHCAIGEVAFDVGERQDPPTGVPAPASLMLLGLGLTGIGMLRRRFAA